MESVKDYAILMLDPEGHIISWNAGAQQIKGYTAEEAIGRHFSLFYTPEAVATGHPQHELEIARSEGRYEEESWRVRKDGTLFWANVVITALLDQQGELWGFGKVTRDLIDRRTQEGTAVDGEPPPAARPSAPARHDPAGPAPARHARRGRGDRTAQGPDTREIPIVILSAAAHATQRRRLLDLGVWAYLTKPFDVPELLKIVKQIIADRARPAGD